LKSYQELKKTKENNYFFIIFFSFLFLYTIIFIGGILLGRIPNYCVVDECRYFENAINLSNATYQNPLVDRLVPPMHSIYIGPFVLLDFGRRSVVYLNLIISCLTISLTYITSRLYLSNKISLITSILYGFYYIKFEQDFTALTEPFTTFLVISYLFLVSQYKFTKKKYFIILSGITSGALSLERPIFFYVTLFFLIITFFMYLKNKKYLILFFSLILSISITVPYQIFTFRTTGKLLFMSNISGETLYWMSSPFQREYGDWNNENFDANCQSQFQRGINCNSIFFEENHGKFFNSIKDLNMIEKNDLLLKKGIENIKNYPLKYARNIISNVSRLFFNFPGSYVFQSDKTILRIIPNSIILNLMIFSFFSTIINIKKIPKEMIFCISFTLFYLFLSSLITAYARMLVVAVPYILIWCAYSIKIWKNS
tara:strand:- start:434 stop:1714 length:1281 start_codon:yes stop_codon:yes gene_type:complete